MNRTQRGGCDPNPSARSSATAQARRTPRSSSARRSSPPYNFIRENKDAVETVANTVIEKEEIYGDDLVRLLDAQNLKKPEIDWTKEESWPQI